MRRRGAEEKADRVMSLENGVSRKEGDDLRKEHDDYPRKEG